MSVVAKLEDTSSPGIEPPPIPRSGDYNWAVWSACRGTPALFGQIARAAVWQIGHYAGKSDCFIDLAVGGDVERFRGPKEFMDETTQQAQRQFSQLRISVRGPDLGADITVAREPTERFSWRQVPSVVLEVGAAKADCEPQLSDIRHAIAGAINRGTFFFFRDEPRCGKDPEELKRELQARVAKRREGVGRLYFGSALAVIFVVVVAKILDLSLFTGRWFAAISAVAALNALAMGRVIKTRAKDFAAKWRRWIDAIFFPAVEVAERTPGRRALRLTARLLSLAAAPFLGVLVKAWLG
jgi:hypothetical protein